MYQSLLPILKPLVFEGKSGLLEIIHKYDDTARLYLKEGIIEQVETKKMQGKKAASACIQWVSISTSFQEGVQEMYTPDPEIDTMYLLSFLEKTSKNITIINKNIPDDSAVYQIDSNKLNSANKLNANDLKIALLFDGKRSLSQLISTSNQSELAILTRTCRLLLSGVAKESVIKDVMPRQEREKFLEGLNEKLLDLVGPAGTILVDDAFGAINSSPDTFAKEDIGPLLSSIGELLEEEEKVVLNQWGKLNM